MKKILFTFFLLVNLIAAANAQTEKGAKLIGGSGTLHFDTEGIDKNTFIALTPSLGFFVADNFALGLGIPLLHNSSDSYKTTSIGLAPFARGYFGASSTKLILEGRGGYNRASAKSDYEMMDYSESSGYFSYGVGAGVSQFLNEHVGLEVMLSYDKADLPSGVGQFDYTQFTGINLNVGFQIYLPSKK